MAMAAYERPMLIDLNDLSAGYGQCNNGPSTTIGCITGTDTTITCHPGGDAYGSCNVGSKPKGSTSCYTGPVFGK